MATPFIETPRIAGILCMIALAATIGACGDSDEGDTNASNTGSQAVNDSQDRTSQDGGVAGNTATEQPETDEGQIKALLASTQEAFKTGDGQVVCDALTDSGQKDIVAYGKAIGTTGDCPKVVKGVADYNRKNGLAQSPSKIVAVRVNGHTATAILRVEGTGPLRQGFRKIDGQWKRLPYGLAKLTGG